jgi:hypothetical protein
MKNKIYLTQEGKKEIEAKIAELENYSYATQNIWIEGQNSGILKTLEEILASAIILPIEESWNEFNMSNNSLTLENKKIWYPQGVIIQPKQ